MRELSRGLGLAIIALLTVLAGLWLAISESGQAFVTPVPPSQVGPTETLYVPSPVLPSRTPLDVIALVQTRAPTQNTTPCPQPAGWGPVTVGDGDTLVGISATHGLSLAELLQANCLDQDSTFVGAVVFVPLVTATLAPTPACGPPLGWVYYTVQPGDTLFALSLRYGVALYDLRQANCLPGTAIKAGQNLFVPPVLIATITASPTNTLPPILTLTNTVMPSATATIIASATATTPPSATVANTASATATNTATNTATATLAATTEAPSATASETASATANETATLEPSATATPAGP